MDAGRTVTVDIGTHAIAAPPFAMFGCPLVTDEAIPQVRGDHNPLRPCESALGAAGSVLAGAGPEISHTP